MNARPLILLVLLSLMIPQCKSLSIDEEQKDAYQNNDAAKHNPDIETALPSTDIGLNFTANKPFVIHMDREMTINIDYTAECENEVYLVSMRSSDETVMGVLVPTVRLACKDMVVVNATSGNATYATNDQSKTTRSAVLPVKLSGKVLGDAKLYLTTCLAIPSNASTCLDSATEQSVSVLVLKANTLLDTLFRVMIAIFIVIITVGFGAKLDLGIVRECMKRPTGLIIGFCCQYVLMPLIAFTIAKSVPIDKASVTFGIFVCGVCPGGGNSNMYTLLFDGDVSLSITMTFVSTIAAVAMMPLWVYTLGKTFFTDDFQPVIPYTSMLQVMATFVIPLLFGLLIKWKSPHITLKILKVLKPVTVIFMLIAITVGIYIHWYIFQMIQPMYFLAGLMLPYIGYAMGGLTAIIFRQPRERVIAIALETGMQNVGVAFLLLLLSFPTPIGDIASLAPMASGLMTPILPFFLFLLLTIYRKCFKKYEPVKAEEEETKVELSETHQINGDESKIPLDEKKDPNIV